MLDGDRDDETTSTPLLDRLSGDGGARRTRDRAAALDPLFALLANERRRHVLAYLTDRPDEVVAIDELEDAVIERERPEWGPSTHRERVEIDLHHVQLPKLADFGVIDHDPVVGTVRYVGAEVLEEMLAVVEAIDEGAGREGRQ